jgi:hypothetical protein
MAQWQEYWSHWKPKCQHLNRKRYVQSNLQNLKFLCLLGLAVFTWICDDLRWKLNHLRLIGRTTFGRTPYWNSYQATYDTVLLCAILFHCRSVSILSNYEVVILFSRSRFCGKIYAEKKRSQNVVGGGLWIVGKNNEIICPCVRISIVHLGVPIGLNFSIFTKLRLVFSIWMLQVIYQQREWDMAMR